MRKLFLLLVLSLYCSKVLSQISLETETAIDSIFSHYQNKPGCAIAIVKDGVTLFKKAYGLANLAFDVPINSHTVFDVASDAKQFTAACIFLLEQEGKLKLDDPIQKYLPEFPVYDGDPITIRNLLHHTSGLRSYLSTLYSKNLYWGDSFDNSDALKILIRHKDLNFPTGTRFYYSNSNYALLASIVKKASGVSLGRYARQKLFVPLGMTSTFFKQERDTVVKNIATGYESAGDYFKQLHYYNAHVIGDGGLHTNLEDFVRWSNNFRNGTVGGDELIKSMMSSGSLANGDKIAYAGGLYNERYRNMKDFPAIGHSGAWAGFRSLFYKFLDQDLAFIILSNNADTNVWVLLDQLMPLFLEDEMQKAQSEAMGRVEQNMGETIKLTRAEMSRFCGEYYNTITGVLRAIEMQGDTIFYKRSDGRATPLIPMDSNTLTFEGAPFVKLTFNDSAYQSMVFTVNDQDPAPFKKYDKRTYSEAELKEFENKYYSEDIDEVHEIVALKTGLKVLARGKELVHLEPFTKDAFRAEHFGYIVFYRDDNKGKVTGFTRYDDHLYNLKFELQQ
ncbi:MAG: serine hydrolase domain-containing protein [Flavobacteriaceae bacterium]